MRTKIGSNYQIRVPENDFIEFVTDKVRASGEVSYSEDFDINEIVYDKENGFLYLDIDMFKRMDA